MRRRKNLKLLKNFRQLNRSSSQKPNLADQSVMLEQQALGREDNRKKKSKYVIYTEPLNHKIIENFFVRAQRGEII
jgi:ABC-type multidrug transport system ATPase subunit